jgi:hypothetical protein
MTEPYVPEFLTPVEHEALKLSGQLANILGRIVGNGSPRTTDLNELLTAVHVIQRAVLANAAARRYPDLYRTLGRPFLKGPKDPLVNLQAYERKEIEIPGDVAAVVTAAREWVARNGLENLGLVEAVQALHKAV